jgi:dTDP-4-dehydrorhamnose reductase
MEKIILLGKDSSLGKQVITIVEKKTNLISTARKNLDILINYNKLEKLIKTEIPKYISN